MLVVVRECEVEEGRRREKGKRGRGEEGRGRGLWVGKKCVHLRVAPGWRYESFEGSFKRGCKGVRRLI